MSTLYTVTKLTPENQSFDDKTLTHDRPSLQTQRLTDDLLSAYYQGRVTIFPAPPTKGEGVVTINMCQLPLPVRLTGNFQGLFTPTFVKEVPALTITDAPQRMVGIDNGRVNFRFRNIGSNPVAIGGADVAFATAVHILQPGEIFDERFSPNVAWYALCNTGLTTTLVGFTIQT